MVLGSTFGCTNLKISFEVNRDYILKCFIVSLDNYIIHYNKPQSIASRYKKIDVLTINNHHFKRIVNCFGNFSTQNRKKAQ